MLGCYFWSESIWLYIRQKSVLVNTRWSLKYAVQWSIHFVFRMLTSWFLCLSAGDKHWGNTLGHQESGATLVVSQLVLGASYFLLGWESESKWIIESPVYIVNNTQKVTRLAFLPYWIDGTDLEIFWPLQSWMFSSWYFTPWPPVWGFFCEIRFCFIFQNSFSFSLRNTTG